MAFNNAYASDKESNTSKLMNILYNKCTENAISSSRDLLDLKNKMTSNKTITDASYKKMQYLINNKNCLAGITDAAEDYKQNQYRLSYYSELKNDEGKSMLDETFSKYKNMDPVVKKIIPEDLAASQILAGQASSIYGYELVGYAFGVLN